jgi:O-antigen/teichoic acid export membrane protein
MTPVTAVLVFFAKDILTLWLGAQFASQSTIVLQLVAVLFFFNAFSLISFTSVQALGRPDLKAIWDLIALPIYAVGAWWLMRRWGIDGAALAKLLISIADCFLLYEIARRMKAFSVRDFGSGPLLRAVLASGALTFVVFLIASLHAKILVSLVLLTICCSCYAAVFWMVAVDGDERVALAAMYRQALGLVKPGNVSKPPRIAVDDTGV